MSIEDRIPVEDLLAFEISIGIVNKNKLLEKLSASMEYVNREIKAFDIKANETRTMAYNDAIIFKVRIGEQTKPLALISPRFQMGRYYAHSFLIGEYCEGLPVFSMVNNHA